MKKSIEPCLTLSTTKRPLSVAKVNWRQFLYGLNNSFKKKHTYTNNLMETCNFV